MVTIEIFRVWDTLAKTSPRCNAVMYLTKKNAVTVDKMCIIMTIVSSLIEVDDNT